MGPLDEAAFRQGMRRGPAAVAVDAGSIDPGPFYLGAGLPHQARFETMRELTLLLPAVKEAGIPLIIGTAGGSGGRRHLEWNLALIEEVARERKLPLRVAVIDTSLDKEDLKRRLRTQRARGLGFEADLTAEDVDACTEVVAQVGVETLLPALEERPDVVLAGRACDDALAAAVPVRAGFDRGLALHMGKLMECAGAITVPESIWGSVIGTIDERGFVLESADETRACTVGSVAAHELYERESPLAQPVPGGTVDMRASRFEQVDPRRVRVEGSRFAPAAEYLVKLEGAQRIGYRSVFISGVRDPSMIAALDQILERARAETERDVGSRLGLSLGRDYRIAFRVYGRNGVMGIREREAPDLPHEVGLVLEVVAPTQELARDIAMFAKSPIMWAHFPGRLTTAGNLAYPFSPSVLEAGEAFRLRVHHLLPIEDPRMFKPEIHEVT